MSHKRLSVQDKILGFKRAVCSFSGAAERWEKRSGSYMSDEELSETLRQELGDSGGSGCKDSVIVMYQGAGLKIWLSWVSCVTSGVEPTYSGASTIKMAREVYNIRDTIDKQSDLFG